MYDETKSTFVDWRNVASIIVHEYSHQWFGNRVAVKWWTYAWLKEGFATLFESVGTDLVFPELKYLDAFVFNVLQNVMISDATTSTRPMTHYAEEPRAITSLFDSVTYSKGE